MPHYPATATGTGVMGHDRRLNPDGGAGDLTAISPLLPVQQALSQH
jgi:hypothetical protein